MTTEAAFYDQAMTHEGAPAMLELDASPWAELYREAAAWIRPHEEVVDLGCGTGRFLHALLERGHYAPMVGIDFSAAALAEAARYLEPYDETGLVTLEEVDLRTWRPDPLRAGNTVYTCLETLEHLELDLELMKKIPPGHRMIASVPNYDSEAHLRKALGPGDLWRRYGSLFTFSRWSKIRVDSLRKVIHLVDLERRDDAW